MTPALIKRVESARGGHDDAAIAERRAINAWLHDNMMPEPKVVVPLDYCSSLDAAVSLCERVLPEWLSVVVGTKGKDGPWAQLVRNDRVPSSPEVTAHAPTPALALVLAVLRAVGK